MTDKPTHTLIVTVDDDDTRYYDIECPQVTDHCRVWVEARCDEAQHSDDWDGDTWFDYTGETEAHGVEHLHVDGSWSHPEDRCWLMVAPDFLRDPAEELNLPAGRHTVRHSYECGGEGAFTLELVETAMTR